MTSMAETMNHASLSLIKGDIPAVTGYYDNQASCRTNRAATVAIGKLPWRVEGGIHSVSRKDLPGMRRQQGLYQRHFDKFRFFLQWPWYEFSRSP